MSDSHPANSTTPDVDQPDATGVVDEPIRIEMDKRVDLLISLVVVALGVTIVYTATGFRIGSFPDPVTSRGVAYFTGTYLVLAGLYLAFHRIRTWNLIPGNFTVSEGLDDEPKHPSSTLRAFAVMGLATLWAILLEPVGFLIVTPIVLAIVLWLMGTRAWRRLFVFPVAFTLALWLIFTQILNVYLPYGPLTPLARSLGVLY